ncbi:MAG: ECF transporter S component [Thaumarchaeota archaeon]|nr:ECF transporter S component [Nitrososphaerota archaeon]MCL5318747.1 ECF transporter S component [Nitrososphaerota archaeon]
MKKVHNNAARFRLPELSISKTRLIALIALLSALTNALMPLSIPITLLGVTTRIHVIQIPILTAALGVGPIAGGLVGLIGATSMVYSVTPPNPFIILYNGLLGFSAGLFYLLLRRRPLHILVSQLAAVVGAYLIQVPFVWLLNTRVVGIPLPIAQIILVALLLEDIASTLIVHPILYRTNLVERAKNTTASQKISPTSSTTDEK